MRLLLDTHALIWWFARPHLLGRQAFEAISGAANDVFASPINIYEIEYERSVDPSLAALPTDLEAAVEAQGFGWLPITPSDATRAGRLPHHHGDPLDRMMIAQAMGAGLLFATSDSKMKLYAGLTLIW